MLAHELPARLLVAEHQLGGIRATVQSSHEAVAISDRDGRLLFAKPAFGALLGCNAAELTDLRESRRADAARRQLEQSLQQAGRGGLAGGALRDDDVIGAILTNASLAAMDLADSNAGGSGVAPLLTEVEASAQRATALYGRIRHLFGQ